MKRKSLILILLGLMSSIISVADVPRKEYPRPQFERQDWVNLNGTWTYAFDFGRTGKEAEWQKKSAFDGRITVPFCPESKLSGVEHTDFINSIWYQRQISIPSSWSGKHVFVNFGAVDYEAHVYIDGAEVGVHYGTGSSFGFDITKYVKAGETHNLIVQVNDDLRGKLQPGGKQSTRLKSYGCNYTRTTGIWQTVWMEAVDADGLQRVQTLPDIDNKEVTFRPQFYHENAANKLTVSLMDGGKVVARKTVSCSNSTAVTLPVKGMKLWSPESPFLYDVVFEVKNGSKVIDRVQSYVGMRKAHVSGKYFYLNNKPYFQRLVLDQGFYPDGIWTAPSDEALKNDIVLAKEAGFNGARLHQKCFEERYYYWADKLGYLTWGESSNWGMDENSNLAARNFLTEWAELVIRDRNHPSLVTWTPFNETWDCNDSGVYTRLVTDVYDMTYALDGTRPVNDASGDGHVKTDIWSIHNYSRDPDHLRRVMTITPGKQPYRNQPKKTFLSPYEGQPFMIDEFGGLPWIREQDRKGSWGYGNNIESLDEFYKTLQGEVDAIKDSKDVVGFCYTQITDVEQEKNGIYYYDRTPKFDIKRIRAIFETIPSEIEVEK